MSRKDDDKDDELAASRPVFSAKWLYIFSGVIAVVTIATVLLFFGGLLSQVQKVRPVPVPAPEPVLESAPLPVAPY